MATAPDPSELPSGLGKTHGADLRLVALLADLRGNVGTAGLPAHAHGEIGQFIELLAESFGAAVGAKGAVNVNAWHKHIPNAHAATYGPLFTAYGHRNIASHANPERELLTQSTVAVDLAAVVRLLPVVVAELDNKLNVDLLDHIERLAEARRWRRTTSGHYRAVVAANTKKRARTIPPASRAPRATAAAPAATVPTPPRAASPEPDSRPSPAPPAAGAAAAPSVPAAISPPAFPTKWFAAAALFFAFIAVGGVFFLLRGQAHATASEIVSEWTVGARWVYQSTVSVPDDYPDEHRAADALTERELLSVRPTKVGVLLEFAMRGGDSDRRDRRALWRVDQDCIESLSPSKRTVRERACLVAEESTDDKRVFKSRKSSWEVHLRPGVGPTLLSWTHPTRGYVTNRSLKHARVGSKDWGDPAVRAMTCDWRISSKTQSAEHRLSDGLVCAAVSMASGRASWRCKRGVTLPQLVGGVSQLKVYTDERGVDWVAAVQRGTDGVIVDLCRVGGRQLTCHRVSGEAESQQWGVWIVSGGSQCRLRLAEGRNRRTNRRRVATWVLDSSGPKRIGGTLPVAFSAR